MQGEIRLLESIRLSTEGAELLEGHESRMQRTLEALAPRGRLLARLKAEGIRGLLAPYLHKPEGASVCKLRMVYTPETIESVSIAPYQKRVYDRIRLVPLPAGRGYTYKYASRDWLDASANPEGVLPIYTRGERLTDTHFSNILILKDGRWLTPREPLLRGVMREHLLELGLIEEADLTIRELREGSLIKLINAMLPMDEAPEMKIIRVEEDTLDAFISLK